MIKVCPEILRIEVLIPELPSDLVGVFDEAFQFPLVGHSSRARKNQPLGLCEHVPMLPEAIDFQVTLGLTSRPGVEPALLGTPKSLVKLFLHLRQAHFRLLQKFGSPRSIQTPSADGLGVAPRNSRDYQVV